MRTLGRLILICLFAQAWGCGPEGEGPAAAVILPPTGSLQDAAVSVLEDSQAADAASAAGREPGVPCAVTKILTKHCIKCHGTDPEPGVPISLVTYADLTARNAGDIRIFERIKERIHATQRPMPPVREMVRPNAEELAVLDDWIAAGATPSADTCAQAASKPDAAVQDYSACEYLPVLQAHHGQDENDTEGFEVPLTTTSYECFNFSIPWDKPVQAIEFFPVIDDKRVVHHMGLYSLKNPRPPGSHGKCDGGIDRVIVGGWSPGQDTQSWPADYGVLMPHDKSGGFQLEIHYDNAGKHKVRDRSGLKVCATSKFRPKSLGMHLLSSDESIQLPPGRQQVVASCTVWSDKGPGTVLAASPHMHRLGVHLRTIVKHTDGTQETISDHPFAFDDQAIQVLEKPVVVKKGDVLTTTCTYDNTTGGVIRYSTGSDGEMCGNALIASPPGSLTGGLAGAVLEGLGVPGLCVGIGAEPVLGL